MSKKPKWKSYLVAVMFMILTAGGYFSLYPSRILPLLELPEKVSESNPEFSKMSKVIDQYRTADLEVIVDGYYRKPSEMTSFARRFLRLHFKPDMKAESWVQKYCYRSKKGEIIYFKYPDGTTKPMRDVFLEELQLLGKNEEEEGGIGKNRKV
ncbi:MAG: hypothetical protein EXS63_04885 [Candidatus Omnitrophica bacterium]|nr:hypothetical protein [Candidatus Omnitrophota bacterium]